MMPSVQLSSRLNPLLFMALIDLALGQGQHLIWIDGRGGEPEESLLEKVMPCNHQHGSKPGPRRAPLPPRQDPSQPEKYQLVFWDGDTKLELDDRTLKLLRKALAERLALLHLLERGESALGELNLFNYDLGIDWERVLQSGVEVVEVGNDTGTHITLPPLPS